MARLIDAVGNTSYNGITFPAALHSKIIARPVYQHGEVSRKAVDYSLTIDTVLTYTDPPLSAAVTANQDMGTNSIQYRKLLTEPRKTLVYGGQGYGDFIVNQFANGTAIPNGYRSVRDVSFGPKPRLLTWEPIGSNRSAHVTWTCDFRLTECLSNNAPDRNAFLEVTYETVFNVNEEGLLTRTVRATLEIAANAQGANFLDTVDKYTTRFKPPVIEGFHRETNRHIERDHRVMQITYTDTEIASDNPFYPGMVQMDASHSVSGTFYGTQWVNVISGTLRWGKGVPASLAWVYFSRLVADRFRRNKEVKIYNSHNSGHFVKRANIPVSIAMTEQIYNREASFNIAWTALVDVYNVVDATGIFTKVPNVTWANWHTSLAQIQSPFGAAGLQEKSADIKVVDVCGSQVPALPNNVLAPLPAPTGTPWLNFSCSSISPAQSWIYAGPPTVKIITIGEPAPQFPNGGDKTSLLTPTPSGTPSTTGFKPYFNPWSPSASSSGTVYYQARTPNQYMLEVKGTVIRVCYEPYFPKFKSYGGVDLILRETIPSLKKIPGQFFPIYVLNYTSTYYMDRLPQGDALSLILSDAGNGDR